MTAEHSWHPARRSPLQHRAADLAGIGGGPDGLVAVTELPFLTQLNLRFDPSAPAASRLASELNLDLPATGRATERGDRRLLWLGPDEWLLITDPQPDRERGELLDQIRLLLGEDGAVTDTSGQRTALSLTGTAAVELLAKGCAIDFHPTVHGVGSCVQTLLAQTGSTIVRLGSHEFLLLVRQSFADYLADWLLDASVGLTGQPLP